MTEWITSIAAVIAAIATVAYFVATIFIFRETRKSANAADKSAAAAENSAEAAQKSVALMREQLEEQTGLAHFRIKDTLESVVAELNQVTSQDLLRPDYVRELPPVESLLTQQPEPAITHAAKIDQRLAEEISQAFDSLRIARARLVELTRWTSATPVIIQEFIPVARQTHRALHDTLALFHKAQATFTKKPRP